MNLHVELQQLKKQVEELSKRVDNLSRPPDYLTMEESAEFLRISLSSMQKLSAKGRVPSLKPGNGKTLFMRKDLIEYLNTGRGNNEVLNETSNQLKNIKNDKQ